MARVRTRTTTASKITVGVLAALTWSWVLAMTTPRATSGAVADYGFFTAVAERLRAGETLYVDVWDNKDPFVFFFLAVARNIGPNGFIGAWLLEIGWVVVASVAAYFLARSVDVLPTLSALVAFVLSPFVLLGMAYFMGSTHLPAVALLLAAIALIYRDHPLAAGIAIGVLLFFKLVMVPMAVVVVVVAFVVLHRRPALIPALGGFVGTLVTVGALLAVRGELVPFIDTQLHNILYSQSPIVSAEYTSVAQKIGQHIVILINPHVATLILISAAVGLVTMPWWKNSRARWEQLPGLWWISAAAFVMAGTTIAVTGKWFHHAEIFAVSSTLVLILVTGWLSLVRNWRPWLAGVIAAFLTYPLAMAPPAVHFLDPVTNWQENQRSSTSTDYITEELLTREPTTVAFVGDLLPRSAGLADWTIVCRQVAQRPFNPEEVFLEAAECLPSAQTIVITRSFDPDSNFPAFTAFLEKVDMIVESDYTCEDTPAGRICTRPA